MKTLRAAGWAAAAALAASPAWAGPGEDGFGALLFDTSARAIGLGGAYTALSDDSNALQYNPGGLGRSGDYEASFMHDQQFAGMTHEHAAVSAPSGWAAAVDYASSGAEQQRTINNPDGGGLDKASLTDLALAAGYGRALGGGLSAGLAGRYVRESIADVSASAFAGSAGLMYGPPALPGLTLGAALLNVGKAGRFDAQRESLPITGRAGAAYRFPILEHTGTAALDVVEQRDAGVSVEGGFELALHRALALRAGFDTRRDDGPGVTAGVGLRASGFAVDYAFSPYGELGTAHKLSVSVRWGGAPQRAAKAAKRADDEPTAIFAP